ncbi:hypothetical protein [Micromonospora cremea]|uniref:Uncharacterized protein n=1 Tax=Micromonospora cremea TaxID=709881 RepID=A0A1N5VUU3_9ACTN|nr:hypothetical protein [Micromonospora cremea]SIM76470.1 hypothetical protein SAMN04489832_1877 [Micromonospora cremea]
MTARSLGGPARPIAGLCAPDGVLVVGPAVVSVRTVASGVPGRRPVEVQVLQQTGGVCGDEVQPVLRWLPEAARRGRANVRRPVPGRAGGFDAPGEALHRPGR